MSTNILGYHFTIEPRELGSEILIAELGKPLLKALPKQKQVSHEFKKKNYGMKTF
jgi:ribosomal protein L11 methyltransferase